MIDCGTRDIIALQLEGTDQWRDARVVPRDVAVPGISDALDLAEESMADRVALLSALEELKSRGLVEQRKKQIRGMAGRRNAYFLTERGREHVQQLREELADETIVIRNGTDEEVDLEEVDRYLSEPAIPRALSRLTENGVLYLDEEVGESFVDREAERALLDSTLEAVDRGETQAVLVSGEAGIGKTTLVTTEFADRARESGFEILVGRCERDTAEPYEPFRSAMSELDLEEDPFDREGIDPEDARSYEAERTAMFEAVVDGIETAADREPLVLVVDDLHLATEPTVALFDHVARRVEGPVLLVGTCRPEDRDPGHPFGELLERWGSTDRRLRIDLDRFDRDDTRRLIQWVIDHRSLPESFVDLVYEGTGGNPLFVKESVAKMREDGVLDPDHGVFPEDPEELPLLDRIEEAVQLRLSVLDDDTRYVLDVGGLVGGTIQFDVLAAAVDLEEPELREHVDVLVDSNVWEREDDRLRFVSGLVRETVVDRLPEDRRRELHERIAEAVLDAEGGDRDHHATVAHHYHRAGRYGDAVDHYREAGDRATAVYANEVALSNYRSALDLLREELDRPEDDPEIVDVLKDVAEVHYLLGEYEEADRHYEYVANRTDDRERLRQIYRIRADMAASRGDFERELELATEGLEVAGTDDTIETCLLYGRKGGAHSHNDQIEEAEAAYQRCLEIAERIDDPHGLAAAYLDFGALDMRLDEVDEGTIEMLEDAVEAAERADGDRSLARALNNLAMALMDLGRIEEAEETFHRCLAVQEAIGDRNALCRSLQNLGLIYQQMGDYDRAMETFDRALDVARKVQNHSVIASATSTIGIMNQHLGEMDLAVEYLEEGLEHARTLEDPRRVAGILVYLVDVHLDRGELDVAENYADELEELFVHIEDANDRSLSHAVLGEIALVRYDLETARERFEAGLAVEGEEMRPGMVQVNASGLVDVAERLEDPDLAREYADTTREAAEASGFDVSVASALVREGIASRLNGDYEGAIEALDSALATYRESESATELSEIYALLNLAKTHRDAGDEDLCRDRAQEAMEIADQAGFRRYDEELSELVDVDGD